ncbi:hypothetical protein LCGC14_2004410, partial [marine sediment metagenome]
AMPRAKEQLANVAKGGYTLVECAQTPELILMATGSEVELAVNAAAELTAQGKQVRVVSMPSTNQFDLQDKAYRQSVLPAGVAKIAVEAAHSDFWYKYVGQDGDVLGMTTFGESAPGAVLLEHFGFTVENLVAKANALLND